VQSSHFGRGRPENEQWEITANEIARFGNFEVDLHARQLHRNGVHLKAEEKPLKVLELLLKNPGEVVSRKALREKLWQVTLSSTPVTSAKRLRKMMIAPVANGIPARCMNETMKAPVTTVSRF
jgi:DNA-binding response OmpR family regulator